MESEEKSPWTFPDIGESKNTEKFLPGENLVNTGFYKKNSRKIKKLKFF